MAEYIEREALKNAYLAKHRGEPGGAYQLICEVPAADVEQVTRCKDCKFNSGAKKCLNPNSFIAVPADDDYCSYGEKRA